MRKLLLAAVPAMLLLGGCNMLGYLLYLGAPPEAETTVEAEFDLAGSKTAVVVYATDRTLYAYPRVREELILAVNHQLSTNVEDIELVEPLKIVRHQQENIQWLGMPRNELGKVFGVDYVLFISLREYSMREPGSVNLFRGHIVAEASIYDTGKSRQQARRWQIDDIRMDFPPEESGGRPGTDSYQIAAFTRGLFAEKLAKYFYDHKAPASEAQETPR